MDRIGVIYEIDDKRAVVLTADSKFVIVKSRPDMNIGQQIMVKKEHIINPKETYFYIRQPFRVLLQFLL